MLNSILLVAYTIDPDGGSEPKIAWNNLQIAAASSNRVHVVTTSQCKKKLSSKIQKELESRLEITVVDIPDKMNHIPTVLGEYIRYYVWIRKTAHHFSNSQNYQEFDIAHHISLGNLFFGSPLHVLSIPYIFGPAGGATTSLRIKQFRGKFFFTIGEKIRKCLIGYFASSKFTKNSLRKASLILATNQDTYNYALSHGATSAMLLLADTIESELILNRREFPEIDLVIWAGRLIPRKAPIDALKAFINIKDIFPNAHLIMFGNGPMYTKCQKFIRRNGLESSVELKNRISWNQLMDTMRFAKCLLFTSMRDSFGSQILEAAAAGTPTVSVRNISAAEWIEPPAIIYSSKSGKINRIEELNSALQDCLSMSLTEWTTASNAAIAFARENSSNVRMIKLTNLYKEINRINN